MFYDNQAKDKQEAYKEMLGLVGSLSKLFSASDSPFLNYRAHENIFCKYFDAYNTAREDCSADATKDNVGIGLKTWVGNDDQKIAEFGRLRPDYENLKGEELIRKIAYYRNERIRVTKNSHGLTELIYHIVKRVPGAMKIFEAAFDPIDIDKLELLEENRGNANNTYFTDGKHTYHFSSSKNTLYMIFEDMELMDEFNVDILDDPYEFLKTLLPKDKDIISGTVVISTRKAKPKPVPQDWLCLRLYTINRSTKQKEVALKSGLNQWNGSRLNSKTGVRTPRDPNELYIPYPVKDRDRKKFFPDRDVPFDLLLPDGTWISAKVCQDNDKAIMSNPNKLLGKWLLRDVFQLPEGTAVTYDLLRIYGIDSIMFYKYGERTYSVDFCKLGTYEKCYGEEDLEAVNDVDYNE